MRSTTHAAAVPIIALASDAAMTSDTVLKRSVADERTDQEIDGVAEIDAGGFNDGVEDRQEDERHAHERGGDERRGRARKSGANADRFDPAVLAPATAAIK